LHPGLKSLLFRRNCSGTAGCPAELVIADSCDDNRDYSRSLNHHRHSTKMHLLWLVSAPACSWQCGGQGFGNSVGLLSFDEMRRVDAALRIVLDL
jgi:hypothetical protein